MLMILLQDFVCFDLFIYLFIFIVVYLTYNIKLVLGVQHSDSKFL